MSTTTRRKGVNESAPLRGLLTPLQVAAYLGCKRSFTFFLLKTGAIRSVKVGRLRRIHPDDLDAYVASLREDSHLR